ncbi:MAG: PLD nuclease N-terminal domain-containing protein [Beijerinckiaceae bacterium]
MRTILPLLIPLVLTGVMVFSIVDLLTIDNSRIKHLPKFTWIILVILLSFVGSLLWFFLGRERLEPRENGRYGSGGIASRPRAKPRPAGPLAPDDDPEFLQRLRREREQQERIRRLEERLGELGDDDKPKDAKDQKDTKDTP